jgi:hypothetical protein
MEVKWRSAYQVAVCALEVEHLDGDNLIQRLAERAVHDGADALPDLLVQLVVVHVDRVLAPLRSPAARRLFPRPRHAADPPIPEPEGEIPPTIRCARSIADDRAGAPGLRGSRRGGRVADETLVSHRHHTRQKWWRRGEEVWGGRRGGAPHL